MASTSHLFSGRFMGLSIPDRTSPSPAFAGSLGLRLAPQWRLAGEVSYSEQKPQRAMINLYYDLDIGSPRFQPFLTIGAGLGGLGFSNEELPEMVWQAGGGVNYRLNDRMSLSGGYDQGHGSHGLRFGMSYKFPVTPARATLNWDD